MDYAGSDWHGYVDLSIGNETVKIKVFQAFRAIADAERSGGDISSLVMDLNSAVDHIRTAEATGDEKLMNRGLAEVARVIDEAPKVGEDGLAEARSRSIFTGLLLSVEIAFAIVAYVFTPTVFWRLWARLNRGRRVKAVDRR